MARIVIVEDSKTIRPLRNGKGFIIYTISLKILQDLSIVRDIGASNMLDQYGVQRWAYDHSYYDLVMFIQSSLNSPCTESHYSIALKEFPQALENGDIRPVPSDIIDLVRELDDSGDLTEAIEVLRGWSKRSEEAVVDTEEKIQEAKKRVWESV